MRGIICIDQGVNALGLFLKLLDVLAALAAREDRMTSQCEAITESNATWT